MKLRVLHIEAGGSYGGSLRALESYLKHSDRNSFEHHLMLLAPVAGVGRLSDYLSGAPIVLTASANTASGPGRALPEAAKTGTSRRLLSEAWDWARLAVGVFSARKISRALRENSYDLVHLNNTFPHQAKFLLAAKFANIPVVGHVRNPVEDTNFNRTMMRWTAAIATVSDGFQQGLHGWNRAVITKTCHDGIELRNSENARIPALRAELLRGGGYLFGSVGRLDEQKAYADLIEAARIVVNVDPGVRFVIAGDGPQRQMLEGLIDRYGLQDKFELCGFRADVPEFVSALDCFVSSSHWEGLPIAIVEAMLLRKPVIATAVGGNAEVFVGREHELVRHADPATLAQSMLHRMRTAPTSQELEQSAKIASHLTDPVRSAAVLDDLFARAAIKTNRELAAVVMNSV